MVHWVWQCKECGQKGCKIPGSVRDVEGSRVRGAVLQHGL